MFSEKVILEKLQEKFSSEIVPGVVAEDANALPSKDLTVLVKKNRLHEILKFLKEDPALSFEMLVDVCGVDGLKLGLTPRFQVVYHLYSLTKNHRLCLKVLLTEEDLSLPTATDLWESANWCEREAYDMFGFQFVGHPHLRRLLVFEGFEGHPLRKDYKIDRRQKIPVTEENV